MCCVAGKREERWHQRCVAKVWWSGPGASVSAQALPSDLWTPKFIFVVEFDCAEYVVRFLTALSSKTLPLFGVSYELEEQSTKFST